MSTDDEYDSEQDERPEEELEEIPKVVPKPAPKKQREEPEEEIIEIDTRTGKPKQKIVREEPVEELVEVKQPKEVMADQSKANAVRFLRHFAEDTRLSLSQVAAEVGIDRTTARNYLYQYVWLVIKTLNDDDYPRRVCAFYNGKLDPYGSRLPESQRITKGTVNHLAPLVDEHGDFQVQVPEVQSFKNKHQRRKLRRREMPRRGRERMRGRDDYEEDEYEDEEDDYEEERRPDDRPSDRDIEPLINGSPPTIMRYVLRNTPLVVKKRIDDYISYFASNEHTLMQQPEQIRDSLIQVFGSGPARLAFDTFMRKLQEFGSSQYQGFGFGYQQQPMQQQYGMGMGYGCSKIQQ